MEPKKLTEEELKDLRDLQQQNANLTQELGSIEVARLNLKLQREKVEEAFEALRIEEQTLSQKLFDTYGNGSLDLENGEFTPAG
jgi:dynactin complex subunit